MAGCQSLTTPFEHKFNPAAPNTAVEDDGRWDAFDPSMSMAQNEMLSVSGTLHTQAECVS